MAGKASGAYQRALGVTCSMSHTGNCCVNAVAECFFWSLKHEWTSHESHENLQSARLSVFQYIETFCTTQRIHQTLTYKTPQQYEADHASETAA